MASRAGRRDRSKRGEEEERRGQTEHRGGDGTVTTEPASRRCSHSLTLLSDSCLLIAAEGYTHTDTLIVGATG